MPLVRYAAFPPNRAFPIVKSADHDNTFPFPDARINVHLIPHSHDDVGWRKTVEAYYTGSPVGWGPISCVRCILDTVTEELWKDPNRR